MNNIRRCCCCFCQNNYPPVLISGTVRGLEDVSNIEIIYIINNIQNITYTDQNGFYSFRADICSQVIINPQIIDGYIVSPQRYHIKNVKTNLRNRNFDYYTNRIVLTRAVNTEPVYMQAPNTWPLHGNVFPNLYMCDKILISLPPSPVVTVKWEYGVRDIAYFVNGGGNIITSSYDSGLPVEINSQYTIYALLENGYEDVETINIDYLRDGTFPMPYLLLDFSTVETLKSYIPEIEQYTLYFMQGTSEKLEKHYEIYENIDMSNKEWEPLGIVDPEYPHVITEGFSGSLFGNNHQIENLTIGNEETEQAVGLFAAAIDNAIIRDLSLINCIVNSNGPAAGFVAISNLSNGGTLTLENLNANGTINGFYSCGICGYSQIINGSLLVNDCHVNLTMDCITYGGGIIGANRIYEQGSLNVSNCTAAGYCHSVANDNSGIVAYCQFQNGSCSITNCYNMMVLKGFGRLGGIVGSMIGNGARTIIISSCANIGEIKSESNAGGISASLIGYTGLNFIVENCYNGGNITLEQSPAPWLSGGIVGNVEGQCIIRNCYNTGNIVSTTNYPRFAIHIGGISGRYNVVEQCVSLGELISNTRPEIARISYTPTYGQTNVLSNNLAYEGMRVLIDNVPKDPLDDALDGVDGLSIIDSILTTKSTYEDELGWDFNNIWTFGNDDYQLPILKLIPANLQPNELPPHLR